MGKRKSRKVIRKTTGPKLDTEFDCPFCGHTKCINVKLDFKTHVGRLWCRACSVDYAQSNIPNLFNAVDLYSDWLDECVAANSSSQMKTSEAHQYENEHGTSLSAGTPQSGNVVRLSSSGQIDNMFSEVQEDDDEVSLGTDTEGDNEAWERTKENKREGYSRDGNLHPDESELFSAGEEEKKQQNGQRDANETLEMGTEQLNVSNAECEVVEERKSRKRWKKPARQLPDETNEVDVGIANVTDISTEELISDHIQTVEREQSADSQSNAEEETDVKIQEPSMKKQRAA